MREEGLRLQGHSEVVRVWSNLSVRGKGIRM